MGRAGAAYIFERNGSGVWSQTAYLKASNIGVNDGFGGSVAINGNYAIVGAIDEDSNSITDPTNNISLNSGAAYIFERNGSGVWSQTAYLKASNIDSVDWFGGSVAINGNYAIVGAISEDSNSISYHTNNTDGSSGPPYIFQRTHPTVKSQTA